MNRLPSLVFAYNLCFYRVSNITWLLFLYDCQTVNRIENRSRHFWIANGINRIMSRIKNRSSLFLNSESNRIWFGKKIQKICYRHHALIRIKVSWISVWIWIPAPRLILEVQFHRKLTGSLTKARARMKAWLKLDMDHCPQKSWYLTTWEIFWIWKLHFWPRHLGCPSPIHALLPTFN